jgi:hypothetical protein
VPARPILRIPAGAGHQHSAMALTDPPPDGDDTDLGYYDTPAGNIWRPDREGNHP